MYICKFNICMCHSNAATITVRMYNTTAAKILNELFKYIRYKQISQIKNINK